MRKHRILHVIGARPHFMKLAPISEAIRTSDLFEEIVCHTGQHYSDELSEAFIREFCLAEPQYRLGIGSGRQAGQIGKMVTALDDVLNESQPDIVFVYGDTNSTAAGAIASAKCHIPVAHVEAGLREWDKSIPEEVNKLLTDAVTDVFFCPTQVAVENLSRIGVKENVFLVGDTVIDLLVKFSGRINEEASRILDSLELQPRDYYLMTCHRAANTNNHNHLREILLAATSLDCPVVFPMHPRTQNAIEQSGLQRMIEDSSIKSLPAIGFWQTQALLKHARGALTDSGGIIKEAYFHKVPCVILDKQTEWIESVNEGWAIVAGPDKEAITGAIMSSRSPDTHENTFGNGCATEAILHHTHEFLQDRRKKYTGS